MRHTSLSDSRTWGRNVALAAVLIAATVAGADGQEVPRQGTYSGRWDVAGKAQKIALGQDRTVTVVKFHGAVVLEGHQRGLARGFRTECVGLQDQKTGNLGRCVWKDRFDHEIWSELSSTDSGAARKSRGTFVGGTGKFEGIEGEYQFEWIYMMPASEEGPVQGYTTVLTGNWKLP